MTNLSNREKILIPLTFLVVAISVTLSLCIGYILPYHLTSLEYVNNWDNKSETELKILCRCSASNRLNCEPHELSSRIRKLKTEEPTWDSKMYPFLVSLTVPAYVDEKSERIFCCSGIIISKIYVLVRYDCVNNKHEFIEVKARVGSIYWSEGGQEYERLKYLTRYLHFVVLTITSFTFNDHVRTANLPKPDIKIGWSLGTSVGWKRNSLRKYNCIEVKKWTKHPCRKGHSQGEVNNNVRFDETVDSEVLVTDGGLLIGFLGNITYGDNKLNYNFENFQCEVYTAWFEHLLSFKDYHDFKPKVTSCEGDQFIHEGNDCEDYFDVDNTDATITVNTDTSTITISFTSSSTTDTSSGTSSSATDTSTITTTVASSSTTKPTTSNFNPPIFDLFLK